LHIEILQASSCEDKGISIDISLCKGIERTIDNTVIESFGSGVEYISPDGFIIVGIGGLSEPGSVDFPIEKEKLGLAFLMLLSDTFPSNRRTPDGS